jgi:hypothetical protein
MIPQAIANAGPYADLWSHIKSMQYALGRALKAKNGGDLNSLDKERLTALARFFQGELSLKPPVEVVSLPSCQPFVVGALGPCRSDRRSRSARIQRLLDS